MKETRAGKYGRFYAEFVRHYIDSSFSKEERVIFIRELKQYSFDGRKKGEPKNEGCSYELSDIESISLKNPEHFARLIKEFI